MSWVVRDATPQDATAIAAIYAPYVTGTAISFEDEPPSAATMAERIAQAQARYAYLVLAPADDPTDVVGYAYAGPFAARPAYRWSAAFRTTSFQPAASVCVLCCYCCAAAPWATKGHNAITWRPSWNSSTPPPCCMMMSLMNPTYVVVVQPQMQHGTIRPPF